MNHKHDFFIQEFSLRNFDLPLLVLEAAVDIDNYSQGKAQEESIPSFSNILNTLNEGEYPKINLPDNCIVLAYAISGRENFEKYWKGKHIEEVKLKTETIIKDLNNLKCLDKGRQRDLSSFCVRLSEEIVRHQEQYYGNSRLAV
jgi:hypothetical protein